MTESACEKISFGRRVSMLAKEHPEQTAIVFVRPGLGETRVSWTDLERDSTRAAHLLEGRGVKQGSMVVIALRNSPQHFFFTFGAWKLGACTLPLNAGLPSRERDQIANIAKPAAVVADWGDLGNLLVHPTEIEGAPEPADTPLPDLIPQPGKAIGSGGSTGRPKIIVNPQPWMRFADLAANIGPVESLGRDVGFRADQVQLVGGPLYHNAPFTWSHLGLFHGHMLVVMERFDPALAVDLIERHRVNWGFLVPTMMRRIIQLPHVRNRDFSSVHAFFHAGAPCPPALKEAWIELLGGKHVIEAYGATEANGHTVIDGDDWLRHRGSVGQTCDAELRILDEDGKELAPGEVGEIFMRATNAAGATYYYIGSPPAKTTPDGFVSVGDLGWVDSQGFLFLADRRNDMIISGGANIYPAEVEAALTEHAQVQDVAVIGLPDEDFGKRVHAVVQPYNSVAPPSPGELDLHCRQRMASYKVPKSYDFVDQIPRLESGKLNRGALAAARSNLTNWKIEVPPRSAKRDS